MFGWGLPYTLRATTSYHRAAHVSIGRWRPWPEVLIRQDTSSFGRCFGRGSNGDGVTQVFFGACKAGRDGPAEARAIASRQPPGRSGSPVAGRPGFTPGLWLAASAVLFREQCQPGTLASPHEVSRLCRPSISLEDAGQIGRLALDTVLLIDDVKGNVAEIGEAIALGVDDGLHLLVRAEAGLRRQLDLEILVSSRTEVDPVRTGDGSVVGGYPICHVERTFRARMVRQVHY